MFYYVTLMGSFDSRSGWLFALIVAVVPFAALRYWPKLRS